MYSKFTQSVFEASHWPLLFLSISTHEEGPAKHHTKQEEGNADSAEPVGKLDDVFDLSIDVGGK